MRDTRRIRSMGGGKEDIERICGDGLLVKLDANDHVLEVTGDGCRISMTKNCGSVRVVGDGCRLNIGQNDGDVEYTGDGGRVCLGPKSSTDNVRYVGNGGKVTVDSKHRSSASPKNRKNAVQKGEKLQEGYAGENISIDESGNDKGFGLPSRKQDKDPTCLAAEAENLLNEQKERHGKYENSGKSKVVTSVNCGGPYVVKKWFVCQGSTIRSYDGDSCTKTVTKYTKTETRVK